MTTLTYRTREKSLKKQNLNILSVMCLLFSVYLMIKKIIQGKNTLYLTKLRKNAKTCAMLTKVCVLKSLLLPKFSNSNFDLFTIKRS